MVGMRLEVSPGHYLVTDDMLNGVVMMILFTCIISTLMTEKASKQIILHEKTHLKANYDERTDDEKLFLCVKYPDIAPQLLELAIMMRNPQLNRGLVALNVVYDDVSADYNREQGLQLLEKLQRQAAASEVKLQTQVRLASNIANGIKHAFREFDASEIIMGMHVHTEVSPKFWGEFIQSLYNGLNRQIVLTRFVHPLNTLRRIQVAVPSRAEFEPGFNRWLERLCRFAGQLDCRVQFHGREDSLKLIKQYINNQHPNVRAEYTQMSHWNELPNLASHIANDNLLVVVTARKGTISYKTALDRLPDELTKYFSGTNLMIIFPDQYGNTKEEKMSFTEAQHHEESSIYDTLLHWFQKSHNAH
jgi:nucleotide-binding universal stress UspA family protein